MESRSLLRARLRSWPSGEQKPTQNNVHRCRLTWCKFEEYRRDSIATAAWGSVACVSATAARQFQIAGWNADRATRGGSRPHIGGKNMGELKRQELAQRDRKPCDNTAIGTQLCKLDVRGSNPLASNLPVSAPLLRLYVVRFARRGGCRYFLPFSSSLR